MNKYTAPAIVASLLVIMLANGATGGTVEDLQESVPLSLAEAMEMSIKARPELSLEIEKEGIALSKVQQVQGNFLPTLDFLASNSYVKNYDTFTGIDISARVADQNISVTIDKNSPPYQLSDELSLGLNLYAGGRDRALLGEALDNLEAARHKEGATLRKVRLEVANGYWGLKKAHIQYAMAKRGLEVVRMELQVAETEHRANRRSDVEYDAVMLKVREKELALKIIDRDCLRAFRHYLHVIGMEEKGMVSSSEQIPELTDNPDSEANIAVDLQDHPDIRRLNHEVKAASEREEAAKSENSPKIDLFAKHSFIGRDSSSLWDAWGDTQSENSLIGIKLSMNLFNGFRTQERINQAEAEVRIKRLQLVQKKREFVEAEHVRKTVLETANDELSLSLARKKLEVVREKVAGAEFQSGRISQLEFRQKVANVENAADAILLAKIDVALAGNALELMVLE
ncbi:MAG: TolC family protein [Pseudomonadota bacterium]